MCIQTVYIALHAHVHKCMGNCLYRGSLEPGLEALFRAAGENLLSLKIVNCDSTITAR